MSEDKKTTYYCLNALGGDTWTSSIVGTEVTYNKTYDLSSESDLKKLEEESNPIYKNIAKSKYLNQILWILDNIYIPGEDKQAEKDALLARAGIKFEIEILQTQDCIYGNGDPIELKVYKYDAEQAEFKDYRQNKIFKSN